ncbi:UROD/MetE-like protein [Aulographum hederae CBS 113979]|uniref:UROD/MetE-like protein n=1 Tax=Aulographum hederae CBS 113979 TaxID=1176131 RepID=A0A6G1H6M8_9PEZI|nr:UROD/MetE-like protein [Aulographum hederae CBS 113979]
MTLPTGIYRADHVGSFLRPKPILSAREHLSAGTTTASSLRALEDTHVTAVVRAQLSAGLSSITDGEFRRAYFHLDFLKHLDGVEVQGNIISTAAHKDGFSPPKLLVTGKLGHSKSIQVDDYLYLREQIAAANPDRPTSVKVCIPSPTMVHFRGGRSSISEEAYPSLDPSFFDDLARVYREELADLYAAGCRTVQLDDTNLAYLCDAGMRAEAAERHGVESSELARQYARLINAAVGERPKDMTVGIHLCRGNYRSQWFAQGGYEPVAEVLFKELDVDAYFLEYDDARSGDFAPLRHLPAGKVVVLGVMSSKKNELDNREEIAKRVREAAGFCGQGLQQLCLSHQCGFSSTMEGNELSEEEQWAKVRAEVEIAKELWGEDLSK